VLTPKEAKSIINGSCTLDDLLLEKLDCIKILVIDVVSNYMATADLHATENKY
jgi:hypothetical protein